MPYIKYVDQKSVSLQQKIPCGPQHQIAEEKGDSMLEKTKTMLISEARKRYQAISPCGRRSSIEDCFSILDNCLVLWFNTNDNSTHVVVAEITMNEKAWDEEFHDGLIAA
jgi:hypothetical protein